MRPETRAVGPLYGLLDSGRASTRSGTVVLFEGLGSRTWVVQDLTTVTVRFRVLDIEVLGPLSGEGGSPRRLSIQNVCANQPVL